MELDIERDLVEPLLELADRFTCTMEMATYLAMLMMGGPKKFFLWYYDGAWRKVVGKGSIAPAFQKSLAQCDDDLELALFLMRVWQQRGSNNLQPNRWSNTWQVNHQELVYLVEQERDQLLAKYFYHKSDKEYVRPVDLLLISKVRLLIAYHLVHTEQARKDPRENALAIRGGIYRGSSEHQTVPIHPDSVCYGRELEAFVYFFPDQDKGERAVEAQQVIYIPPEWLAWLKQEQRDEFQLTLFLLEKTRFDGDIRVAMPLRPKGRGETRERFDKTRLFLEESLFELFKPFASIDHNSDDVSVRPYYGDGAAPGKKSERDDVLQAFQPDQHPENRAKHEGTISQVYPYPRNYALVRFRGGPVGVLRRSRIWGRGIDIKDEEQIRVGKPIFVYVERLDKRRKIAELDARLPELNPLKNLQVGQQVEAVVDAIGRPMKVNILPQEWSALCLGICDSEGSDIQQASYRRGEIVLVEIKKIIAEDFYIEVCIIPTSL